MKKIVSLSLSALCLVVILGCGNKVPLSGKVVFSDNSEPVPKGIVMFESGKFMSRGTIQSDGTFQVGSLKETDGIPPGEYRVSIIGAVDSKEVARPRNARTQKGVMQAAPMSTTYLIDRKYERASTSGLTYTVSGSGQNCELSVDRPKTRK